MKQQLKSMGATLALAALALIALMLAGCSHPAPPPAATAMPNQTHNLSPDDAVKSHMKEMQQNGAGN